VTELLLVRHGETDWNAQQRWQGQGVDDPPLNAAGVAQAEALAESLRGEHLAAVYSSDLRRALETAEIVAAMLELDVVPLPGLREIDVGSWSGLTRTQLEERFPEQLARHRESWGSGWEGGERIEDLTTRVVEAIQRIAADHPDDRVLAVTHGGVIRALTAHALAVPFTDFSRGTIVIDNCGVARFACRDGALHSLD
jgi:broad specificity phosphatase PhoE